MEKEKEESVKIEASETKFKTKGTNNEYSNSATIRSDIIVNTLLLMAIPLIIVLSLTVINREIGIRFDGRVLGVTIKGEAEDRVESLGITVRKVHNTVEMNRDKELICVYNCEAGNLDTWGDEISASNYLNNKLDIICVNGDIIEERELDTNRIEYTFSNNKKLIINNLLEDEVKEFSREGEGEVIEEIDNLEESIVTEKYKNNVCKVYKCNDRLEINKEDRIIVDISVLSIMLFYIIALAIEIALATRRKEK